MEPLRRAESSDDNQSKKRKSDGPTSIQKEIKNKKLRNYRTRKNSDEYSDKVEELKMEHLPSNIDADSDFSIDSSDTEEEKAPEELKNDTNEKQLEKSKGAEISDNKNIDKPDIKDPKVIKVEETKNEKVADVIKPKINIWKKRTVGEKFNEAVKRYFERKALREIGL